MLSWEEFVELRNLHERGWSISAIARHLGKDRKTVRRYLADPDAREGCGPSAAQHDGTGSSEASSDRPSAYSVDASAGEV